MSKEMTDWKSLPHELPDGMHKYLMMLCEAGSADSELKLLTRFQKTLRLIHDEYIREAVEAEREACAQDILAGAASLAGIAVFENTEKTREFEIANKVLLECAEAIRARSTK